MQELLKESRTSRIGLTCLPRPRRPRGPSCGNCRSGSNARRAPAPRVLQPPMARRTRRSAATASTVGRSREGLAVLVRALHVANVRLSLLSDLTIVDAGELLMRRLIRRAWEKITSFLYRVNGLFGVRFERLTNPKDVASRLFTYLGGCRVLHAPYSTELPDQCVARAMQMRTRLETLVDETPESATELRNSMVAMRNACLAFVSANPNPPSNIVALRAGPRQAFMTSLGVFRGAFANEVAAISKKYRLEKPY